MSGPDAPPTQPPPSGIRTREGAPLSHPANGRPGDIRVDLLEIGKMVAPGTRVLDIGCGDGSLLYHLVHDRQTDARGIEISQEGVYACVARGLSVVQGDADTDLANYPSGAFDTVILSQTLQATHRPHEVLAQMLRIGREAIVSFPNFGHWKIRFKLLTGGRMPQTEMLTLPWYETPNIHLCTIRDFMDLCQAMDITIQQFSVLDHLGKPKMSRASLKFANFFGVQGLFLLRKNSTAD